MSLSVLPHDLTTLTDEELLALTNEALNFARSDRQDWQLTYYKPTSKQALRIHLSTAHLIGIGGGNRSGKTDTNLAEAAIQATGIIPESLKDIYPREKLRGAITIRVVCESHTTTLAPVILHKLNYSNWNGVDTQGGERGHWGWVPKDCLVGGSWDKSWKESKRQLTTLCRDPDNPDRVLGHSVWQFMSHDQDPAKFASGEFHLVIIDEPPKYAIYRENRARIMSVGGRMMLGMTWPDDPTIAVDWIFDELYDIGQAGPNKNEDVEWIELNTLDNPNIDQESVQREAAAMSEMERACRIGGKPIRFSNRIHPEFTDSDAWWCFTCRQEVLANGGVCATCDGLDVVLYNHVQDFMIESRNPAVFVLDPHPRKPHMFMYVQVDAADDYSVIYAGQCADEPTELKKLTDQIEREMNIMVARRLIDPNMGASPASSKRGVTWQDEFADAGIYCDLAVDSDVGRGRVDEYLKPDSDTKRPRLRFHDENCAAAIYQMKRYVWSDWKYSDNKDQKQVPKQKYDDYPTMLKYLMNDLPLYKMLKFGGVVVKPRGTMKAGY
jgi:hypothetical protein